MKNNCYHLVRLIASLFLKAGNHHLLGAKYFTLKWVKFDPRDGWFFFRLKVGRHFKYAESFFFFTMFAILGWKFYFYYNSDDLS